MLRKILICLISLVLLASFIWGQNLQLGEKRLLCSPFTRTTILNTFKFTTRNYSARIGRELEQKIEKTSSKELFPVIVEFDKLIDSKSLYNYVKDMRKSERRDFTIKTLKDFTTSYQKEVMVYLEEMKSTGQVKNLSQLWLTNSIGMEATKDVIKKVAKYSSVALIWLDNKLSKPFKGSGLGVVLSPSPDSRAIVWNVLKINADQVWSLGYTGQNIIVGHVDTGVNYNHVDLADHLWDGGSSYPNHGWDFIDNDNDPMDQDGHGTHTAGTVAGDGTAGTQTGVAPDAQIMCLRAVPGNLNVLQNAVNFALNQGADVVTMSAGWDSAGASGSWNYISTQTRTLANNCLTAGIVFSVSAGNGNGYGGHYAVPYDINIPANVPAPWYGSEGHSAVIAVGATNSNNSLAYFSSHGATQWFFSPWYEYQYPPGLIKPDVVAPGGSPGITSLNYANNTGYVGGWQGTSMSCPHLTGTIALILSKDPNLTPEQIDSIIESTCLDLGSSGRDNYYGAGLINALDAVNAVGIEEKPEKEIIPSTFSIFFYPNPARNSVSVRFSLPQRNKISMSLYDVSGRKISSIVNGQFNAGIHNIVWNRKNEKGNRIPRGIYFIWLRTETKAAHGKLILIN